MKSTFLTLRSINNDVFLVIADDSINKQEWFKIGDFAVIWNAAKSYQGRMIVHKPLSEYNENPKCLTLEENKLTIGIGKEKQQLKADSKLVESYIFELSKDEIAFLNSLEKIEWNDNATRLISINKSAKKIEIL